MIQRYNYEYEASTTLIDKPSSKLVKLLVRRWALVVRLLCEYSLHSKLITWAYWRDTVDFLKLTWAPQIRGINLLVFKATGIITAPKNYAWTTATIWERYQIFITASNTLLKLVIQGTSNASLNGREESPRLAARL